MNNETTTIQDPRKGGTSASNAQADLLCEGRHLAQRGIPETDSEYARFGQAIHSALKTGDPSQLSAEQLSIYESSQEIESSLVQQVFGHDSPKVKTFREERYWVKVKDGELHHLHSGQSDAIHRVGPTLLICEYKSLPGDVPDSPTNLQLRDQVVLTARNLIAQEAFTVVIQPLVTHDPELCRYDSSAIAKAEEEMFARVRRSNNPNAKRTPGKVQCQFCLARLTCQEHLAWAAAELPERKEDSPFFTAMTLWSPEQRSLVAEKLPTLEKLLGDAKAFLKDCLAKDPNSVPGFMLKPGAVRTEITDAEALFSRFVELGGTLDQFMKCVNITKGELEAQVRGVTKKKGKGLLAELNKLLEGITEQKQNQPSLSKVKEAA
jgi:hypothetical protein